MTKRRLTEMQQKFLDVLYNEAQGNFVTAKRLAGYSENVHTQSIVDSLQDEIYELTKKYISSLGVKAAWSLSEIIDNPTALGNREKLAAIKDVLDRANFKPSDKVEVTSNSPVFILPPKNKDGED